MDASLLEIICCPETHLPLAVATTEQLAQVNQGITRSEVVSKNGRTVETPLAEALWREDGRMLYPVQNGIPLLLSEEGIPL